MKFQNLNRKLKSQDARDFKQKQSNKKKLILRTIIILVILTVAIYLPVRMAYSAAKEINRHAKFIAASAKNENLDDIRLGLKNTQKSVTKLNSSLNILFWVRFVPFLGGYYADSKHFVNAASFELKAAQIIADSLDPYKNELGFTGTPTPGQDRVSQFVKVLEKTIPNLDKVEPYLEKAASEVKNIKVDKYPEKFGRVAVREKIDLAKNGIIGAHYAVSEARSALEVAPSALGVPTAKNYLIIFQNDKEIRATGGFMTAYAYIQLDNGRISSSTSDDIYRLDEKLLNVCKNKICPLTPPEPIVKYLPEENGKPRSAWSMRDSNISPDLPTSIKNFERMYELFGEGLPFDGIIMIDTHVVEELIKITGPIEVFGTKYSAENDKRCSCPNVIFELENYAQVIEKGEADRKAILGTLMQQILARSLGASTEKLPEFINAGVNLANNKHAMFFMHDTKLQQALSELNWTGEIKQVTEDYLHINDSNFAGGKSNMYVKQDITLDITGKDNGPITNKLTIVYKNPQPYNIWLNGINRDYVRIYVPNGSKLISSKGSEVKVTTIEEELGKTVFEAFIQVRPQNSTTINFEYQLPDDIMGKEHKLLIQKQPGKDGFKYSIKVNGKEKQQFLLEGDKELKLAI